MDEQGRGMRRVVPRIGRGRWVAALLCAWSLATPGLAQTTLDRAALEAQINQGEAEQARRQLEAARGEHAGELWYEYLLGRAQLASGQRDAGIATLRALLDRTPGHDPSRFLLAEALSESGDEAGAIEQYTWLAENSPLPAAREVARNELGERGALPTIAVAEMRPAQPAPEAPPEDPPEDPVFQDEGPGGFSVDAFLSGGYDTNANNGTDVDRFARFELIEENKESESAFAAAGAALRHVFVPGQGLRWGNALSGELRRNFDASFADSEYLSAQSLLRWTGKHHRLNSSVVVSGGVIDDHLANRVAAFGAGVEWLTRFVLLSLDGELSGWRFPDAPLRNVDGLIAELSATPPPAEDARWVPSLSVMVGNEDARVDNSPFGRDLWGVSGGIKHIFSPKLNAELSGNYSYSDYEGAMSLGAENREDERTGGGIALNWRPDEKATWAAGIGLRYLRNKSNETLYDYERGLVIVELSKSWGVQDG